MLSNSAKLIHYGSVSPSENRGGSELTCVDSRSVGRFKNLFSIIAGRSANEFFEFAHKVRLIAEA